MDERPPLDNRMLAAIVVSLVVWYAWLVFVAPPVEPAAEEPAAAATPAVASADASAEVPEVAAAPVRDLPAALCEAHATMSTGHGGLHSLVLPEHQARYDVQPVWSWVLSGLPSGWRFYGEEPGPVTLLGPEGVGFVGSAGALATVPGSVELIEESSGEAGRARSLTSRRVADGVVVVEQTLRNATAADGGCRAEFVVRWRNASDTAYAGGTWVGVYDVLEVHSSRYDLSARPVALLDGGLDGWDDETDLTPPQPVAGAVDAFGFASHYFAAVAVPPAQDGPPATLHVGAVSGPAGAAPRHGVSWVDARPLAAGEAREVVFGVYVGPKDTDLLEAFDPRLSSLISLGFLSALGWPLLWLLRLVHGAVGNWGVAIVGLTLLVKAAFFRLTQQAFASQQAMQEIAPKMKALQDKYKDNPAEMQQRVLALYQEAGVNPLSGCLPMLVQMPVWFALYSVLLNSVELYHADFLYLRDLSAPDPYMISPAVVTGLMFAQQLMMPTANLDPAQARLMKLMPLMFGVFSVTFPSGLVVYIFVNTLLSILQQAYIKRTFRAPAATAA